MSQSESKKRVFTLKPLSKDGIDGALDKADHYRLLNQPKLAESICLDVLNVDPENQRASVSLLLALTDQFGSTTPSVMIQAREIAGRLKDVYSSIYYLGIVHERQGNVALNSSVHGSEFDAYEWFTEAMDLYEKAQSVHPTAADDSILRWNTCARTIMQFNLRARPEETPQPIME